MVSQVGVINRRVYRRAFGSHSPWGDEDSPAPSWRWPRAFPLERGMSSDGSCVRGSVRPSRGSQPAVAGRGREPGTDLTCCSRASSPSRWTEDRRQVEASAVVGERALLEQGVRTSTLRAVTECRPWPGANGDDLDHAALAENRWGHHPGRIDRLEVGEMILPLPHVGRGDATGGARGRSSRGRPRGRCATERDARRGGGPGAR